MPTLGEACQTLRIGRVTLAKWIERLGIETTRHEWDWRFTVIAPEDVERIAEARRKVPGRSVTGVSIPSYSSLAFDRRSGIGDTPNTASPTVTPVPRQRAVELATLRASGEGLPDGMMSKEDASRFHGVPTTTLRRWCREGRIETTPGRYGGEHGHYGVVDPLTRRGHAQLHALASHRADFRRCADCPHAELEEETPETISQ